MIEVTPENGIRLTDPENDRKEIHLLIIENKIKLCLLECKSNKRLFRIAISTNIAVILLLLILILQ